MMKFSLLNLIHPKYGTKYKKKGFVYNWKRRILGRNVINRRVRNLKFRPGLTPSGFIFAKRKRAGKIFGRKSQPEKG